MRLPRTLSGISSPIFSKRSSAAAAASSLSKNEITAHLLSSFIRTITRRIPAGSSLGRSTSISLLRRRISSASPPSNVAIRAITSLPSSSDRPLDDLELLHERDSHPMPTSNRRSHDPTLRERRRNSDRDERPALGGSS